jgi:hypothetical protein
MTRKVLFACVLVSALTVLFTVSAAAQGKPQVYVGISQAGRLQLGSEEPCNVAPGCVFYAGDFDPAGPNPNGLWNSNNTLFGITGTVYVPFIVPKKFKGAKGKTDWNVQGLFVNEQMLDLTGGGYSASSVDWSIVQGVALNGNPSGGAVKTICSGTGTPTLTPTGRIAFGIYIEYTILVTGVSCPTLERGQYWMTVLPTTLDLAYLSDVEDNTPPNAQGPGAEPIDQSFFVSPSFGFPNFSDASSVCGFIGCDAFSTGAVGTAVH